MELLSGAKQTAALRAEPFLKVVHPCALSLTKTKTKSKAVHQREAYRIARSSTGPASTPRYPIKIFKLLKNSFCPQSFSHYACSVEPDVRLGPAPLPAVQKRGPARGGSLPQGTALTARPVRAPTRVRDLPPPRTPLRPAAAPRARASPTGSHPARGARGGNLPAATASPAAPAKERRDRAEPSPARPGGEHPPPRRPPAPTHPPRRGVGATAPAPPVPPEGAGAAPRGGSHRRPQRPRVETRKLEGVRSARRAVPGREPAREGSGGRVSGQGRGCGAGKPRREF